MGGVTFRRALVLGLACLSIRLLKFEVLAPGSYWGPKAKGTSEGFDKYYCSGFWFRVKDHGLFLRCREEGGTAMHL